MLRRRVTCIEYTGVVFLCSFFNRDSRELVVLAVAAAVLVAQDQDEVAVGKMAAFFTLMGDTLAMFALQPGLFQSCRALCLPEQQKQKQEEETEQEEAQGQEVIVPKNL